MLFGCLVSTLSLAHPYNSHPHVFHDAHKILFPTDPGADQAMELRFEAYEKGARQSFGPNYPSDNPVESPTVQKYIGLLTYAIPTNLNDFQRWYDLVAEDSSVTLNEKKAAIFVGAFFLSTLHINLKNGTKSKAKVLNLWKSHVALMRSVEGKISLREGGVFKRLGLTLDNETFAEVSYLYPKGSTALSVCIESYEGYYKTGHAAEFCKALVSDDVQTLPSDGDLELTMNLSRDFDGKMWRKEARPMLQFQDVCEREHDET